MYSSVININNADYLSSKVIEDPSYFQSIIHSVNSAVKHFDDLFFYSFFVLSTLFEPSWDVKYILQFPIVFSAPSIPASLDILDRVYESSNSFEFSRFWLFITKMLPSFFIKCSLSFFWCFRNSFLLQLSVASSCQKPILTFFLSLALKLCCYFFSLLFLRGEPLKLSLWQRNAYMYICVCSHSLYLTHETPIHPRPSPSQIFLIVTLCISKNPFDVLPFSKSCGVG